MNSALLYYRMGLDHTNVSTAYRLGEHKLIVMSFEAPKYVPGLRHYLFFFRRGAAVPEYSYQYEVSDSGCFLASWEGDLHHNYGPAKAGMTFDEFKQVAFDWVARRESFRPSDVVAEDKPTEARGFLKRLFGRE